MRKTILVYLIVGLVLVAGLYWLIRRGASPGNSPPLTPLATPLTSALPNPSPAVSTEARQIDVTGDEFSFDPTLINARVGENIRIVFTNAGRFPHNLVIEGVAQSQIIGSGESDAFEFVVPPVGEYSFLCSVPGHAAAGMKGVLKVE
ncbi:MAG: cupredoxin domain-containing protein [Candidatus Nealsonbacteria bacterium]|nr:cupredoxin domain-containing protein [Candidatus Nealsonbacteria bacterium]